jgi:hypothetical protein
MKVLRETIGSGGAAFACVLSGAAGEKIKLLIKADDAFMRIVNRDYIWIGNLVVRKDAITGVRRNFQGKVDLVYTDDNFLGELLSDTDTEQILESVPEILKGESNYGQEN